jgi:FkbM family methyltransferase
VTSHLLVTALRAKGLGVRGVVDVGANVGQFARAVTTVFPGMPIVSVEPSPEAAAVARSRLQKVKDWTLLETAVGATIGTATLRIHRYSPSSSLLPARPGYVAAYGKDPNERLVEVPLTTLDVLLQDSKLPAPWLLKLDVQGFEADVLRGSAQVLGRCSHVLVEASFIDAYEGEASFETVHAILHAAGFEIQAPLDTLRGKYGEITQVDFLYRLRGRGG